MLYDESNIDHSSKTNMILSADNESCDSADGNCVSVVPLKVIYSCTVNCWNVFIRINVMYVLKYIFKLLYLLCSRSRCSTNRREVTSEQN